MKTACSRSLFLRHLPDNPTQTFPQDLDIVYTMHVFLVGDKSSGSIFFRVIHFSANLGKIHGRREIVLRNLWDQVDLVLSARVKISLVSRKLSNPKEENLQEKTFCFLC